MGADLEGYIEICKGGSWATVVDVGAIVVRNKELQRKYIFSDKYDKYSGSMSSGVVRECYRLDMPVDKVHTYYYREIQKMYTDIMCEEMWTSFANLHMIAGLLAQIYGVHNVRISFWDEYMY